MPRHFRVTGPIGSIHNHMKEDVAGPDTITSTGNISFAHLHHAGSTGAVTNAAPNPQERVIPGRDVGDSTVLSLPALQHR